MSDQLGHVDVATNGNRTAAKGSEHMDTPPSNGMSTEERLSQLMETIQSWDWRTDPAKTDQPPSKGAPTSGSVPTPPVTPEGREDPVEALPNSIDLLPDPVRVRQDPLDGHPDPTVLPLHAVDARHDAVDLDLSPTMPSHAPTEVPHEPVPVPEAPRPPISVPTALGTPPEAALVGPAGSPSLVPTAFLGPEGNAGAGNSSSEVPSGLEPGSGATVEGSPIRRLWSHRWTKAVVLCGLAVAAVLLIIWSIRLAHSNPGSSASSTAVTQPASSHGTPTPARTSFVSPITSGQMARYNLYAYGLSQANATASKAIVAAGAKPTTAQLSSPIEAYHTAVNLYDFQLRFIQWPASMQASIADDHAQLEALVSFLATFSSTTPSNMSGWLSGLHIRTTAAQTTDNLVRRDLGLPSTNSFP